MNIKKIVIYLCVVMFTISSAYPLACAKEAPFTLPDETEEESVTEVFHLTVEKAVSYGLEHNTSIQILDNKIELAEVTLGSSKNNQEDLEDAEEALEDAEDELSDKKRELRSAQEDLDAAKSALSGGIAPVSIPLTDSSGNPITDGSGNQVVIPAGSNILNFLVGMGMAQEDAEDMTDLITSNVEGTLNSNQGTIDENEIKIKEAETTLSLAKEEFKNILKDTSEKLGTKINYNSIVELDAEDAGKLMVNMAGVNLDLTRYAKNIYKNQIAMLIQKNYYDALYAQKVLKLKKVAKERGEKQYNMVKLSYENGMKAKDDLLLAKMYYDSTVINYRYADATYKGALYELKKNMNLNMDQEITLEDTMKSEITSENLEDGLKSGITNRLEIQQALGQLAIYELNEDILKKMGKYGKNTYPMKEARLLREGAELQLEKTKTQVKAEINQSYETMVAAGDMLQASKELIENAEGVVTIAQLKYEQGFGAENALLKQMNLQDSAGTIIELIAAQEKLSEVESQVAQITYSYTLAKLKYLNDSGVLTY